MMEGYNNNKNMVNEEMAVDDRLCLDQLPVEILLIIFDYCHAFDLVRTAQACKRFHSIIRDEFLWYRKRKKALATNQVSSKFRERCNPLLCSHAKWKVTHNWEFGRYETNVLFSQNTKLMPWIQLTNNILWWSGGNQLCGYFRRDPISFKNLVYRRSAPSDFCKFVVKNDYIISGHRDGGIRIWTFEPSISEGRNNVKTINNAHNRDVETVDETSDVLFSGSSDEIVKAWTSPRRSEMVSNIPLSSIRISDRIWSLAADPTGSKLAIGSAGNRGPPLSICDVENFVASNTIDHKWKRGAGILDMVWENPNTLLTCGYDTCVRKWDLRCGKCVSTWADPTDATIYCLSSDYQYTMVTGTQFNCKTVLWDQRKPHYVQLYFMNLRRMSSPVYSVSFDSCHLYGATDQTTVEVKFSGQPRIKKNYREIMNYKILPAQGRN